MTETISEFIKNIENNSLIVTLLSGGIIITLFRYITDILNYIWKFILNVISFEIVSRHIIDYQDPIELKRMMLLFDKKAKTLYNKVLEFSKAKKFEDDDKQMMFTQHGLSIKFMYGKLLIVHKSYNTETQKPTIIVETRVFFANKKKFTKRMLKDITEINVKGSEDNINVDVLSCYNTEKPKRSIDTVYTANSYDIIKDVKSFVQNRDLYHKCGIPYKRNYLFYGKPGTGKTSMALAIASELDWDIVVIDIHKSRVESVIRSLNCRSDTIFLFEDIDAMGKNASKNRDKKEDSNTFDFEEIGEMSLGQLLNITDGLMSPLGCICIFTTNHIDKLDDALIRDGRMDVKVEFKYFSPDITCKMVKDKLNLNLDPKYIKDNICPASLQEQILSVLIGKITQDDFLKWILIKG
jgi:hypothetical protein